MTLPKIKSCPFCGGEAYLMNTLEHGATNDPATCFVFCLNCGADGPQKEIFEESDAQTNKMEQAVIEAWNKRII